MMAISFTAICDLYFFLSTLKFKLVTAQIGTNYVYITNANIYFSFEEQNQVFSKIAKNYSIVADIYGSSEVKIYRV